MAQQLVLLEAVAERFRIDERTREIGLRGVAEVKRILSEKAKTAEQREHPTAA